MVREYHISIEDGVETEKTLVKEGLDPAPVDNVIYYAPTAVGASGISPDQLNVSGTMHAYATWYNAASSGKAATDPSYGITRSGAAVTRGIVATDPSVIPLGTRLYIPGYGFAVAGDTGGGIVGDKIDLGFPDGVQVDWHTGWVDIYILSP
jgi:3D (Asp-Asp-Asp) domain-containing protein